MDVCHNGVKGKGEILTLRALPLNGGAHLHPTDDALFTRIGPP